MGWLADLEAKITRISDTRYRPRPFSLEQLLVGASHLYGLGSRLHHLAHGAGILKSNTLPCPVISVGNIIAGGTGKTPMTTYLAKLLQGVGLTPVVISRGYQGQLREGAAVVGDGKNVLLEAAIAGDEPHMMAQTLKLPVVVGRQRHEAGRLAIDAFDPDVLVLDDGFQHLKLERDLDLVLMDYERPLGNRRLLPAGRLREDPGRAGDRAHALVLTRCPEDWGKTPEILTRIFPHLPVFKTRHKPILAHWSPSKDAESRPDLSQLKDRTALLVSGIARNDAFARTVESLGVKILDHLEFQDHYRYKRSDFLQIQEKMEALDTDLLLTTEKDWVKFPRNFSWKGHVAALGIEMEFQHPGQFETFIRNQIKK